MLVSWVGWDFFLFVFPLLLFVQTFAYWNRLVAMSHDAKDEKEPRQPPLLTVAFKVFLSLQPKGRNSYNCLSLSYILKWKIIIVQEIQLHEIFKWYDFNHIYSYELVYICKTKSKNAMDNFQREKIKYTGATLESKVTYSAGIWSKNS